MIEGMFLSVQVVLPQKASGRWETKEEDLTGTYTAAYQVQGTSADETVISKEILAYLLTNVPDGGPGAPVREMETRVRNSETRIEVPVRGLLVRLSDAAPCHLPGEPGAGADRGFRHAEMLEGG